jgi:hypothetical protein
MFRHDHAYFHALYGEFETLVDIRTGLVLEGDLPSTARALVADWARQRREELMENWELCRTMQTPKKLDPLA